jgi:hypothetical protein
MNTNQVLNKLFYIGRNANAVNSISNHSDEVHCPGFCDRWTGRSSLNLRHALYIGSKPIVELSGSLKYPT